MSNSNSNSHQQHYQHGRQSQQSPPPLPLYAITGLSHILTTSEACHILGKQIVRAIVRSFLRFTAMNTNSFSSVSSSSSVDGGRSVVSPMQQGQEQGNDSMTSGSGGSNSKNQSSNNSQYYSKYHAIPFRHIANNIIQQSETEEERYWVDLITASLAYNFINHYNNNNHGNNDSSTNNDSTKNSSEKSNDGDIPDWCITAWHRILNLPPQHIYTNMDFHLQKSSNPSSSDGQSYQHQQQYYQYLNSQIPSPILGLDKTSFLKAGVLFPSCSSPHREKDGHLVLMEYAFAALATPNPALILNKLAKICNNSAFSGNPSGSSSNHDKVTLRNNVNSVYRQSSHLSTSSTAISATSVTNNSHHYMTDPANTPTTNYNITGMNDNRATKSIILLPDLIIFWAISYKYQHMYDLNGIHKVITSTVDTIDNYDGNNQSNKSSNDSSTSPSHKEPHISHQPSPPSSPLSKQSYEFTQSGLKSISHAAELTFRIYNTFQKRDVLSRDILNQFMNDIYGADTIVRRNVSMTLDQIFISNNIVAGSSSNSSALPHAPTRYLAHLNQGQFIDSIQHTARIIHNRKNNSTTNNSSRTLMPEQKVVDWIMTLGSLPDFILQHQHFYTSCMDNDIPSIMKLSLSSSPFLSTYKFLQAKMEMLRNTTMDNEIRILCRKFGIDADSSVNTNISPVVGTNSTTNSVNKTNSSTCIQLYEVRRRFRSVIELSSHTKMKTKNVLNGDENDNNDLLTNSTGTDSTGSSCSDDADSYDEGESNQLPIDDDEGKQQQQQPILTYDDNQPQPRNVIDEEKFLRATTESNDDFGHGGFLTPSLAKLVFQAGCATIRKNRDQSARKEVETFIKSTRQTVSDQPFIESDCRPLDRSEKYWTLYDVLFFGCNGVRGDSIDEGVENDTLLRFVFSMFLLVPKMNNNSNNNCEVPRFVSIPSLKTLGEESQSDWSMTKYQVGYMLLLLMDHAKYRSVADSPPSSTEQEGNDSLGNTMEKMLLEQTFEDVQIEITVASQLFGSLPSKFTVEGHRRHISLSSLVDFVFEESVDDSQQSNVAECLSYQSFVKWCTYNPQLGEESLDSSFCRIGQLLLDLRLMASTLFGVKPSSSRLEHTLINEIFRRYYLRFPASDFAKRGPAKTVWYVIPSSWWKRWEAYVVESIKANDCRTTILSQIENNKLVVDNGSLALRPNLRNKQDFEVMTFD